jgi:vacuolar protein sorting-associated protein 18
VLLGRVPRPELSLYSSEYHSIAEAFAFLTGTGVYFGELKPSTMQTSNDSVLANVDFLEYPPPLAAGEEQPGAADTTGGLFARHSTRSPTAVQPARSLGLTEFHFLLLYPDRFEAICRLSRKVCCAES